MQKSINGSGGGSRFDNSRLPASQSAPGGSMNGHQSNGHSINTSRIPSSDHHYQKHQPQHQTHAGKLLKELGAKPSSEQQSNYIVNGNQQTLLKKHVYMNGELDALNLFHLPEQGNQLDGHPQVIHGSYEQAKNEQQMLSYYSKALMVTILAGVVMFTLNLSIFLLLVRKKRKIKRADARQKQTENDEQQQQTQKQLQEATDHHLKMINNEELVQYEDYLEVNYN